MPESILSSPTGSAVITSEDHQDFWQIQRESTQSSPSALHFGIMKATAKDDKRCATIFCLVSIPYESGYSPDPIPNYAHAPSYRPIEGSMDCTQLVQCCDRKNSGG